MGSLDKSLLFKKGKVTIQGMDAMVKAFRELSGDKANAKMVVAMKYALQPLVVAVKANAPIRRKGETTGLLKKSIGIKVKLMGRLGNKRVVGLVGPKMKTSMTAGSGREIKPYKYAHLVERGTVAHSLKSRKITKLKAAAGAYQLSARQHPGATAKPFLAPAIASTGNQIFTRFTEKIKEIIKAIAMKGG